MLIQTNHASTIKHLCGAECKQSDSYVKNKLDESFSYKWFMFMNCQTKIFFLSISYSLVNFKEEKDKSSTCLDNSVHPQINST